MYGGGRNAPGAPPRFSLLLLEDGEDYVDDWVATAEWPATIPGGGAGVGGGEVPGRVRLASRSLLFEPDDARSPIVRLPLASVTSLEATGPPGIVTVAAGAAVRMRAGGADAPYAFDRPSPPAEWTFRLLYAPLDDFMPEAMRYLALSRLPRGEVRAALAAAAADRAARAAFDPSRLADYGERILLDLPARLLSPLVGEAGRFVVTDARIYFSPLHADAGGGPRSHPLALVTALATRRCSLHDVGLEVFLADEGACGSDRAAVARAPQLWGSPSALLAFATPADRDAAMAALTASDSLGSALPGGRASADAATAALGTRAGVARVAAAWRSGALSNLDYLLFLNLAAGRSFQDVRLWPAAPWVVADFESETLDLSSPSTFRDLSKPMGALDPARLARFRERYDAMAGDAARAAAEGAARGGARADPPSFNPAADAPFMYGTHYSTPGYVMHWLLRAAPAHLLRLQGGRFDAPDRLFNSVAAAWASASRAGGADVRELIPEFYLDDPAFLVNARGLPLGRLQGGAPVGDVDLPPWAPSGARAFLAAHRAALESAPVSANLHHWVDLVFGCKQGGEAAARANNVFHPLTVGRTAATAAAAAEAAGDAAAVASLEAQVDEFGQAPAQLFGEPHARRSVAPPWAGPGAPPDLDAPLPRPGAPAAAARAGALVAALARVVAAGEAAADGSPDDSLAEWDTLPADDWVPEEEGEPAEAAPEAGDEGSPPRPRWATRVGGALTTLGGAVAAGGTGGPTLLRGLFARGAPPADAGPAAPPPAPRPCAAPRLRARLGDHPPTTLPGDLAGGATAVAAARAAGEGGPLVVFAGGVSGALCVWAVDARSSAEDPPSPPRRLRLHKLGTTPITSLALLRPPPRARSGGLPLALAGTGDGRLFACSAEAGGAVGGRAVHGDALSCLAVSGPRLVTGGWDGGVRVWSLADARAPWARGGGPPAADLTEAGSAPVWCVAAAREGALVAAGSDDGTVRLWDSRVPPPTPVAAFSVGDDFVAGVEFLGDASTLVAACGARVFSLDARAPATPTLLAPPAPAALRCLAVAGAQVVAGGDDGSVHWWEAGGEPAPPPLAARPGAAVAALALAGGGPADALVTAHDDGAVMVREAWG